MNKNKIFKLFIGAVLVGIYSLSFGATKLDHFEVTVNPESVGVGETVDLTLTAVGADGKTITDYAGTVVIYSDSDPDAEFPGTLSSGNYTFKAADSGKVKFENALKFSKAGTQTVDIFDNDSFEQLGTKQVVVKAAGSTTTTTSTTSSGTYTQDISLEYPTNGLTIGTNSIKVNGNTKPNSQVQIFLNNSGTGKTALSNGTGFYELELKDIPSGENTIYSLVLDADNKIIGKSKNVFFTVDANNPQLISIITGSGTTGTGSEFLGESLINLTINATPKLMKVEVLLNDVVKTLTETTPGVYTGTISAPKDIGTYGIDVTLSNELGKKNQISKATTITVKAPELNAPAAPNCDEIQKELVIGGVNLIKLKSKSVLSWDKIDAATSYNVYKKDKASSEMILVENTKNTQIEINISGTKVEYDDFAIKAVLENDACKVSSKDYSKMTKVQTGPKELIVLLISMILTGAIFAYRRKTV